MSKRTTLLAFFAALSPLTLPTQGDTGRPAPWTRFAPMDEDGDGKISKSEFSGPIRIFERVDTDGDGFITPSETAAMRRGIAGSNRPGRPDRQSGGTRRSEAPKVGDTAPVVKAVSLATGKVVDLSSPKKTTVLVFGSHT